MKFPTRQETILHSGYMKWCAVKRQNNTILKYLPSIFRVELIYLIYRILYILHIMVCYTNYIYIVFVLYHVKQ